MKIIYDIETYPDTFTLSAKVAGAQLRWQFIIGSHRNDGPELYDWMQWLRESGAKMVGFNNVGFDYPVIHQIILNHNNACASQLYEKAMEIIQSQNINRFAHLIYADNMFVPQIDLFKIHHFDNVARSTSLKALEFAMRLDNIQDLPIPLGKPTLIESEVELLLKYNMHDVEATEKFYFKSLEKIEFRDELSKQTGVDFTNFSDVKIGAKIFELELNKRGVTTRVFGQDHKKVPLQTMRPSFGLGECIPSFIRFDTKELNDVVEVFRATTIRHGETKGVFKDLSAEVNGLIYYFGTGGVHASVSGRKFVACDEFEIIDIDVKSFYPQLAIGQHYYPQHLGDRFVDIYKELYDLRQTFDKSDPKNGMLKLALNGTYGGSNDIFSIFYDPKFTMLITIGGQLMIALLAELLSKGCEVIQANTDGMTVRIRKQGVEWMNKVCGWWEQLCSLELEYTHYSRMWIADVNSYIAEGTDGKLKRKGRYEHDLEWHKDPSALVVPKIAELHLTNGAPIRETLESWPDMMDFMIRVKVPRSSRLELDVAEPPAGSDRRTKLDNTSRVYAAKGGGSLIKVMPPLASNPNGNRYFDVLSGVKVCVCNSIADAVLPIDYDYYEKEIDKLVRFT